MAAGEIGRNKNVIAIFHGGGGPSSLELVWSTEAPPPHRVSLARVVFVSEFLRKPQQVRQLWQRHKLADGLFTTCWDEEPCLSSSATMIFRNRSLMAAALCLLGLIIFLLAQAHTYAFTSLFNASTLRHTVQAPLIPLTTHIVLFKFKDNVTPGTLKDVNDLSLAEQSNPRC